MCLQGRQRHTGTFYCCRIQTVNKNKSNVIRIKTQRTLTTKTLYSEPTLERTTRTLPSRACWEKKRFCLSTFKAETKRLTSDVMDARTADGLQLHISRFFLSKQNKYFCARWSVRTHAEAAQRRTSVSTCSSSNFPSKT